MKQVIYFKESDTLHIKLKGIPPEEWKNVLGTVKSLTGSYYTPSTRIWKAPCLKENIEILKNNNFPVPSELNNSPNTLNIADIKKEYSHIEIPNFDYLRPYQKEALQFLKWRKGKGLIAFDMGLGKTVVSLSYLKMCPELRPVLIIVPATIKIQWYREYLKWTESITNLIILNGKKDTFKLDKNCNYIINWDILDDWKIELKKVPFQVLIADEIQYVSNPKTKRTKAFQSISRKITNNIFLSGTPIKSKPSQFFTVLNLLNSEMFNNRWKFYERYCGLKFNGFGYSFDGADNTDELHERASLLMIRKRKKEVLKDLPDKIKTVVPLEIENLSAYVTQDEMIKNSKFENKKELENKIKSLQYTAFDLKKKSVIEWIKNFLESGQKLIVFAYHRAVVEFLTKEFSGISVKIYGGTASKDREKAIYKFIHNDKIKLMFGNILSVGVGTDGLQKICSNAAFVELDWVPSNHLQAEDRIYRINQKNSVNIFYLIAPNTVEETLMLMLDEKMKIFNEVVDGIPAEENSLLKNLMEKYQHDR